MFSFTDFVFDRGLLRTLLCTPYEQLEGWVIAVCRFRGTRYMCMYYVDTEKKLQLLEDSGFDDERHEEMCYWGFKFESYITAGN